MKRSGTRNKDGEGKGTSTRNKFDDEVDELFKVPLSEFISARKTLAATLKQSGHGAEAERIKTLVKPSTSAWTVNQLYWNHREAFEKLIATSVRFRHAQASRLAGKAADMRGALDERREALAELEVLATDLLREAGHNPTIDMVRRITTTLEALSAYASTADGPEFGRLTHDVDPPGFESLGSFGSSGALPVRTEPTRVARSQKSPTVAMDRRRGTGAKDERDLKEIRQAKIAAAKASLQEAKRELTESRANLQRAQTTQKRVNAELKEAEKEKRDAEQRLDEARLQLQEATRHAKRTTAEVEEALKTLAGAEHTVESAAKELEAVFRDSPTR
ncbi:MAG TPA: hypothetical protein VLB68_11835 [Pyrinomonadaceae bacterium]|nr:hypothetical protein [Pyrinomonadaceae bacterium]